MEPNSYIVSTTNPYLVCNNLSFVIFFQYRFDIQLKGINEGPSHTPKILQIFSSWKIKLCEKSEPRKFFSLYQTFSKTDNLWSCWEINNLILYQYLEYWKMQLLLNIRSLWNKTTIWNIFNMWTISPKCGRGTIWLTIAISQTKY